MKFQVAVLFLIYSITLIYSASSNDDHKHHKKNNHHKDSGKDCVSKLEDLHMDDIISQGQEFMAVVWVIGDTLVGLIQGQIDMFAASRDELRASFQATVESVQKTLNDHVRDVSFANMEADDAFWECIDNAANFIRNDFPGTLMAQADACIDANTRDLSDIEEQVAQLNETALADLNRICDCVDCISSSPSKTEKKLVEVCVNNTAQLLNIEVFSNKATSILQQVEEMRGDLFASLQACIGQVDIAQAGNNVLLQIDGCVPNTPEVTDDPL